MNFPHALNKTGNPLKIDVIQADYRNSTHAGALVALLDSYARDPMGGGQELSDYAKQNLVAELAKRPSAFSVLAFVDGDTAGLANCFEGFSTFKCRPLVNIHDLAVLPAHRGRGVAQAMLNHVEEIARERGCCKITLEVLQGNQTAQNLYRKLGFAAYQLDAEQGHALFWQKKIG
ncbi:MAG: GNAT family N-acetyltransferase [Burkholderiales bacterium]